mmetsp:Transcript_22249/g.35779  ORF Transcript_22249/g.35779 Transcript_22249/m.35779 type:complete len:722 (-) Transcript_22249:131-2296(-)
MGMDPDSEPEEELCPICIEPLDEEGETKEFRPCKCGYRLCMFCVRRIQTEFDGRCPGCRRDYKEEEFRFVDKPISASGAARKRKNKQLQQHQQRHEVLTASGSAAHHHAQQQLQQQQQQLQLQLQQQQLKAQQQQQQQQLLLQQQQQLLRQQQQQQQQQQQLVHQAGVLGVNAQSVSSGAAAVVAAAADPQNRKDLANVRVVQRNLVYLIGLAPSIAAEETLRSKEFFGQYGKIIKVALNRNSDRGDPSYSAYITFAREQDATSAIKAVNGFPVDGHVIKASYGTTKYCNSFLRGVSCNNPDCLYLHKLGDVASSFTKEEMASGNGSFQDMTQVTNESLQTPPPPPPPPGASTSTAPATTATAAPATATTTAAKIAAGTPGGAWGAPAGTGETNPIRHGGWAAAAAGLASSSAASAAQAAANAPSMTLLEQLHPKGGIVKSDRPLARSTSAPGSANGLAEDTEEQQKLAAAKNATIKRQQSQSNVGSASSANGASETADSNEDTASAAINAETNDAGESSDDNDAKNEVSTTQDSETSVETNARVASPVPTSSSPGPSGTANSTTPSTTTSASPAVAPSGSAPSSNASSNSNNNININSNTATPNATTPSETVLSLLATLAGIALEEYNSMHPNRKEPRKLAPGAEREQPPRPQPAAVSVDVIHAEVEKARAQVALQVLQRQRYLESIAASSKLGHAGMAADPNTGFRGDGNGAAPVASHP